MLSRVSVVDVVGGKLGLMLRLRGSFQVRWILTQRALFLQIMGTCHHFTHRRELREKLGDVRWTAG